MSDAPEFPPARRRPRWSWMLALLLLGVGGGAYAIWRLLPPDDVLAAPESVELPPMQADREDLVDYLAGEEGRLLSAFVAVASPLVGEDVTLSTCRRTLAELDAIGTPDQVFASATGTPDRPTAEMAVGHVAATARFLGRCLESGKPPAQDEVRFTSIVLNRRLDEAK